MTAAEIKYVKSLSQKKFRDEYGVFAVEGEKMVSEALSSAFEVIDVYRIEDIGEKAMSRISALSSPSPVLAVVKMPVLEADAAVPGSGLYLALDGIRDPGNLGSILRTADWFGVDGIYASGDTVDVFNPKVVQASMGAIFRVAFRYTDIPSICRRFLEAGADVYGTFLDGDDIYSSPLSPSHALIVVGNEANGISRETAANVSARLRIPSYRPGSESLNAAVATAVTLAEFRRR